MPNGLSRRSHNKAVGSIPHAPEMRNARRRATSGATNDMPRAYEARRGLDGRISPRTHGRGEREGAGAGVAVALAYTTGPMAAESASWGNGSPV